jgi:hypothetical protein
MLSKSSRDKVLLTRYNLNRIDFFPVCFTWSSYGSQFLTLWNFSLDIIHMNLMIIWHVSSVDVPIVCYSKCWNRSASSRQLKTFLHLFSCCLRIPNKDKRLSTIWPCDSQCSSLIHSKGQDIVGMTKFAFSILLTNLVWTFYSITVIFTATFWTSIALFCWLFRVVFTTTKDLLSSILSIKNDT